MKHLSIIIFTFYTITLNAYAGNLSNGQWQPAQCGPKSPVPPFNTQSADDYNKSLKEVMAWQSKTQEYYNCLVKEANADNETISKSANTAQDEFSNEVNKIQKEAEEAKAKAEKN
jgi:hypothetical protein